MNNSMENLIYTAINNLKELADANTVIGTPLKLSEAVTVVPISKVSVGLGLGGSDIGGNSKKDVFGAGTGAGLSINPIAFIIMNGSEVTIAQIGDANNTANKIVDLVPEMFDKVSNSIKKNKNNNQDK